MMVWCVTLLMFITASITGRHLMSQTACFVLLLDWGLFRAFGFPNVLSCSELVEPNSVWSGSYLGRHFPYLSARSLGEGGLNARLNSQTFQFHNCIKIFFELPFIFSILPVCFTKPPSPYLILNLRRIYLLL
jgi:hypothetical protein